MTQYLLTKSNISTKVHLLAENKDTLTIQDLHLDFSDCACSTPQQHLQDQDNEISLDFVNRESEIQHIMNPARSPIMVIDAPAGYGKSKMLHTLQDRFSEKGWESCLVSLDEFRSQIAIRREIVAQLKLKPINSSERTPDFILRQMLGQKNSPLLFLFDVVEQAHAEDITWLLSEFLPGCRQSFPVSEFRVIFAGRYVESSTGAAQWLNCERVSLSPFNLQVVMQIVEQASKKTSSSLSNEKIEQIARVILELSGGHPKSIENLIKRFANGWVTPTTIAEKQHLFNECTADEKDEVLDELDPQVRTCLESIFVFRRFTLNTLKFLQQENEIPADVDVFHLLTHLTQKRLIAKSDGSPFYSDQIVRDLILAHLRLFEPERYRKLNRAAHESYKQWIGFELQRTDSAHGLITASDIVPILVTENIYHICQQYTDSVSLSEIAASCISENIGYLVSAMGQSESDPDHIEYLKDLIMNDAEIRQSVENHTPGIDSIMAIALGINSTGEKPMIYPPDNERNIYAWLVDTLDMLRHNAQNILIERWEKRNQGKAVTPPVFADRQIPAEQLASVSREQLAQTLPRGNVLERKLNSYRDASGQMVLINEKYVTNLKEQMESAQATKGEYELELTRALSPNERIQAKQGLEESTKNFNEAAVKLADIYAYLSSE